MSYVMHFCRNKKCNNGWIDIDLTNVKTNPPEWKYCKKCAQKLGINYYKQTQTSNLNEIELIHLEKKKEQAKIMRERSIKNINSTVVDMGGF